MNNVKSKNPVKQIMDETNDENVFLFDDKGRPIEFEQVAVIPLERTNTLYAILIPVTPMEGVSAGEGVLFAIDEEKEDLTVVKDEDIIDDVLEIYSKLIGGEDSNK